MRNGDWEAAWQISDGVSKDFKQRSAAWVPRHLQAVWDGRPLRGKTVLVRCYHGLGDTIQFIRFAASLRKIARRVIVWAQPQLLPLLETADGVDALLPLHAGKPQVEYDCDMEIMELPYALRTTLATLPAAVPYLRVQCSPVTDPDPRPRVGLVWQAGDWDDSRSIAPELLQELTRVEGVSWEVLQRGPAVEHWTPPNARIPRISNMLEEASQLRALDLLICVDTCSAHLAGALGVRTWTLLPAHADWRWMEETDESPWYPTMRLFRQHRAGEWQPVLQDVSAALRQMISAP
jgi:hypothetical protein